MRMKFRLIASALFGLVLTGSIGDAAARGADASIADLLGRRRSVARSYGSGINLHYDLDNLLAQARRWVDAGFDAVKMKVGSPDLARDVERVAAVGHRLGLVAVRSEEVAEQLDVQRIVLDDQDLRQIPSLRGPTAILSRAIPDAN